MGKITSIVGLVLIVAAGILAAVSTNYETQLKANKVLSEKYIKNAKEALTKGDKKAATKFLKMAFKADPDNKQVFKLLQEISGATTATKATTKTEDKKAADTKKEAEPKKPAAPAAEEEEEEDGLGC